MKLKKVCIICKNKFYVYPSQNKRKYYSKRCYGKSEIGKNNPHFGKKSPQLLNYNKKRRGKTIEEIHGKQKSKNIHKKMSLAQIGNCKGKGNLGKKRSIEIKLRLSSIANKRYAGGYIAPMSGRTHSKETIEEIKKKRALQITPMRNSSIEIKIQNFLSKLHIEYFTHKYISEITHTYQCDIFIPKQNEISNKTIIECDGCFFHACQICNLKTFEWTKKRKKLDKLRTEELIEKGFRVIRFWEHDIKVMELNDFEEKIKNV